MRTCGVTVAEWSVKTDVGELTATNVLLLWRDWREDDAVGSDATRLSRELLYVVLADSRKAQEPENAVGNAFQYLRNINFPVKAGSSPDTSSDLRCTT